MCRTMQTEVHIRFWSLCAILQKLPWAWSAAGFIALRCVTAGMGLMISGGAKMTITEQQGPEPEWWEKQTGWRKDGAPTNLFLIPGNRVVSSSNNNLQTTQRWLLIGRLIRYSHSRAITVKKENKKVKQRLFFGWPHNHGLLCTQTLLYSQADSNYDFILSIRVIRRADEPIQSKTDTERSCRTDCNHSLPCVKETLL